jgi:type I restriction-modification system DNA methylase subunit
MNDFHQFRDKIRELVKAWKTEIQPTIEKTGQYGETNTRKYLIDPILEALNWVDDGSKKIVDNEFSIRHATGTGSADYALKVNNVPKILVEAKDVAKVKDLEHGYDIVYGSVKREYPRQLSNYCHDLNYQGFEINFSILTNGKEWIVYNMQYADISSEREVILRLKLEELDKDENLQKLWALEYDDFCKGYSRLREIIQQSHDFRLNIDKKAVQELLECKELLSSSIIDDYEENKRGIKSQIDDILNDKETINEMPIFQDIPEEERLAFFIKEASSFIINKIVFIRILEDKNFLTPKLTKRSIEKWKDFFGYKDYNKIMNLFRDACEITETTYNGGLFKINPYDKIEYDPLIIKKIIDILGEIKFRDIDSDIIGRIYEIYLGQILKVESESRGKKRTRYLPDNTERKKLGQYYTPKYIVDFIVRKTLGKLIEGKTPDEVGKIRILDPACGSGSFLINAFDVLAEYYENWNGEILKKIEEMNKKHGAKISHYQDTGAIPDYRNIILKENVHGVDLNDLSVQICEINLWLRALERDKKLLKLNKNILHGNSLISGIEDKKELSQFENQLEDIKNRINQIKEYYDKNELTQIEENRLDALEKNLKFNKTKINSELNKKLEDFFGDELKTVSPFNWNVEFPQIMNEGGFDIIIGNPPYIDSEIMVKTQPHVREFYSQEYLSAKGNWDIFCIFIEKSLELLKEGGMFGMIIPNKLLSADYAHGIRNIIKKYEIQVIRDYSRIPVFDASVYPIVIIIRKKSVDKNKINIDIMQPKLLEDAEVGFSKNVEQALLDNTFTDTWAPLLEKSGTEIISKIIDKSEKLGSHFEVSGAASVSEAYEIKEIMKELSNEKDYYKFINTGTIDRYESLWGHNKATYIKSTFIEPIVTGDDLKKFFQNRYLQSAKSKIIIAGMTLKLECFLDLKGEYLAGKSTTIITSDKDKLTILIGILNSNLMTYCYKNMFKSLSLEGGYIRVGPPQIKELPIILSNQKFNAEIKNHCLRISQLKEAENNIHREFVRVISNQSVLDSKSCKFANYFDNYEPYNIKRETFNKINEIQSKISSLDIHEEGDKLNIYLSTVDPGKKSNEKIKAITLTIIDDELRKFLFFSLKKIIDDKGGRDFGTGNLLESIKKIYVPQFIVNINMNLAKIKEVMKEFKLRTNELWWKDDSRKDRFDSLTEIEIEIENLENKINNLVYELYGITDKEKSIIEEITK